RHLRVFAHLGPGVEVGDEEPAVADIVPGGSRRFELKFEFFHHEKILRFDVAGRDALEVIALRGLTCNEDKFHRPLAGDDPSEIRMPQQARRIDALSFHVRMSRIGDASQVSGLPFSLSPAYTPN